MKKTPDIKTIGSRLNATEYVTLKSYFSTRGYGLIGIADKSPDICVKIDGIIKQFEENIKAKQDSISFLKRVKFKLKEAENG